MDLTVFMFQIGGEARMGGGLPRGLLLLLLSQLGIQICIAVAQCALYYSYFVVRGQSDTSGPVFIQEPPNNVDFSNTTGTKIICQARGVPLPNITWTKADGEPIGTVPGLRQVRGLEVICTIKLTELIF